MEFIFSPFHILYYYTMLDLGVLPLKKSNHVAFYMNFCGFFLNNCLPNNMDINIECLCLRLMAGYRLSAPYKSKEHLYSSAFDTFLSVPLH